MTLGKRKWIKKIGEDDRLEYLSINIQEQPADP